MQPKFTRKMRGKAFLLTPVLLGLFTLFTGRLTAQTYVNAPLSTGATALNGSAAPAGTTWSECMKEPAVTTVANSTAGSTANGTFTVADDFTIPSGSWNLTKITFFGYVTGSAASPSPITFLRIRIHNGNPALGPTTIVFGDLTTNRITSNTDAGMFRIFNTLIPPTATGTTRRLWRLECNVSVSLPAGTYWIEFQDNAGFVPLSTPMNVRTLPGYNAIQSNAGVWTPITDAGVTPAGVTANLPVNMDLPFILDYTTTACAAPPTPGNTIASAASVCPGNTVTLTVQNPPAGSGVTYQWQSSPTVSGTYTNISGATSSSYVASPSAATCYRAIVTCTNPGGGTATSTPVCVAITPPSGCYCIPPAMDCTDDDEIIRVRISTLDNASACSAGPPAGYGNFTALPAPTVYAGAGNPITVNFQGIWSKGAAVWIDYNQNGNFETSEFTSLGTGVGTVTSLTANINIPSTATLGNTRMRVRTRFGATAWLPTEPCTNPSTFGETEDYTVNIQPCVPITITGSPANVTTSCGGNATFTVTTSGTLPQYVWEYRPNSSSAWQFVPNAAPYSGINSATLTITNAPSTLNGYQYRAVVVGGCSATDVSGAGTLTVNQLVPVVSPASATICTGTVQQLTLTNTLGSTDLITEGFESATLPAGWNMQNLSTPIGTTPTWLFNVAGALGPAQNGTANSYALGNFNNVAGNNTISNWLITPQVNIKNGDQLTFWSRTVTTPAFPDRLEVRMSTAGASTNVGATNTSVGDFTTLLLTINSGLTVAGYPNTWTQFTATVSGLGAPTSGRFAFRYFVTSGGPLGANSDNVGIDNVRFTSVGGPASGVWTGPAGTMWTNAGATVPYTGTPATTIYVNPTATSTYQVSYTTLTPCTSATTSVPVTVVNPVGTVTQPANTTRCSGTNATFTASATGGPNQYQWQVSTDGGLTYTNISGATGTTLTVSNVTTSMTGYRYRLAITAAPCLGTTFSNGAILTVNALPTVTISAPDLSLAPGQTTVITGTSTPAPTAGTWVWTLDHNPIPGTTNTQSVNINGLGTYQASVTDVNGCVNLSNELTIGAEASDRLWIYPNPSPGAFQVRLYYGGPVTERRVVRIFKSNGQLVMEKEFTLDNIVSPYLRMDFDLSHLSSGTYVVKVDNTVTGKITSGLVVVHRDN